MGEKMAESILPTTCDFHGKCTDLLHAAKLGHGTEGFTSPPEEGMQRIFVARKIRRLQPGLSPRTWVPEASMLTTRPLKPLKNGTYERGGLKKNMTDFNCKAQNIILQVG
jgi:hypothetical protein